MKKMLIQRYFEKFLKCNQTFLVSGDGDYYNMCDFIAVGVHVVSTLPGSTDCQTT